MKESFRDCSFRLRLKLYKPKWQTYNIKNIQNKESWVTPFLYKLKKICVFFQSSPQLLKKSSSAIVFLGNIGSGATSLNEGDTLSTKLTARVSDYCLSGGTGTLYDYNNKIVNGKRTTHALLSTTSSRLHGERSFKKVNYVYNR